MLVQLGIIRSAPFIRKIVQIGKSGPGTTFSLYKESAMILGNGSKPVTYLPKRFALPPDPEIAIVIDNARSK